MAGLDALLTRPLFMAGLGLMSSNQWGGAAQGLLAASQNRRDISEQEREQALFEQAQRKYDLEIQRQQMAIQAAQRREAQALATQGALGVLQNPTNADPAALSAAMWQVAPDQMITRLLPQQPAAPFARINPAEYTPASVAEFQRSGDYSVLRKVGPTGRPPTPPAGYYFVNPNNPGAGVQMLPGYNPASPGAEFANAGLLRKEYIAASKPFIEVRDAYARVLTSAQKPTPAGDLSLIYNYAKLLDPGSVVREAEFQTAANAAPILQRLGLDWNRVQTVWEGKKLTDEQRADFVGRANSLYAQQRASQDELATNYRELAARNGLDPSNVIVNYHGAIEKLIERSGEPPAPPDFNEMPPASLLKGRILEDDNGKRFRSDGMQWREIN